MAAVGKVSKYVWVFVGHVLLLGLQVWWLWPHIKPNKEALISAGVVVEGKAEEITAKPEVVIKTSGNKIEVKQSIRTPYYGNITQTAILDKRVFLPKHSITVGAGFMLDTLMFAEFGYAYRGWGVGLLAGYNLRDKDFNAGIKVSKTFSF